MQAGLILIKEIDGKTMILLNDRNEPPIFMLSEEPIVPQVKIRCSELLHYHYSYFSPKIIGLSYDNWHNCDEWTVYLIDTIAPTSFSIKALEKAGLTFKDMTTYLPETVLDFIYRYLKELP